MGSSIGYFIKNKGGNAQKLLYKVFPFKYRYGKKYLEFLKFLGESKKWSYDESKSYQLTKTKEDSQMIMYHTTKTYSGQTGLIII
jgi:hypothetical protein